MAGLIKDVLYGERHAKQGGRGSSSRSCLVRGQGACQSALFVDLAEGVQPAIQGRYAPDEFGYSFNGRQFPPGQAFRQLFD
ncbi:hypothetical protein [Mesorhizobium sp. M1E.F.Ca.ET.045.02.1.1]|uniref:hypothetical protein n=1 Tax=Mesorhizobium sp. M1E.F.Ca.ET.045.02.1.1 TaxID=2493672 RepID=UPI001FE074EB|nr:hypothetical protein [Mesorhizobium sp. M1E.F.Ca.ET.045.02.1.1]